MGLADDIYSGSASFGQFITFAGAILLTIICVILIIAGIADVRHKQVYTQKITATVSKSTCQNDSCDMTLQYTISNITYTTDFTYIGKNVYKAGDVISVYYNPSNPHDILQYEDDPKFGYVLIAIGFIMLALAWFTVWVTRKYKFAAAGAGIMAIF